MSARNYLWCNFLLGKLSSRSIVRGAIIQGAIISGAIVLKPIFFILWFCFFLTYTIKIDIKIYLQITFIQFETKPHIKEYVNKNKSLVNGWKNILSSTCRSNPPELFLGKGVSKICSNFTREHPCGRLISITLLCSKYVGKHPCWSGISITLLCNFIENKLRYVCSPVNLMHTFRTTFFRTPLDGSFSTWCFVFGSLGSFFN